MSADEVDSLFLAAKSAHQANLVQEAVAGYREVLRLHPGHAGAWHLLGVALHQQGCPEEAVTYIRRAIDLAGPKGVCLNNLGVAFRALGQLHEALESHRQALAIRPDYADAQSNVGLVLHELGQHAAAREAFQQALALQPDHVDALFNFANLLAEHGEYTQAIALYRQASTFQPRRTDVLLNLGNALLASRQASEAEECCRRAREIEPQNALILLALGRALARQDRVEEAAECFRQAAALKPDRPIWKTLELSLCPVVLQDLPELEQYRASLQQRLESLAQSGVCSQGEDPLREAGISSFQLAHHGRNNRLLKAQFAAIYALRFAGERPRPGAGKPRIGFLVTEGHEGGFLRGTAGIIERLDPARFDVLVLCSRSVLEPCRKAIRREAITWVPFPRHLARATAVISETRCDVLYHWQADTDPLNYFLPFAGLAPVQCTSWDTHGTSGIPAMDYYLSCHLLEPSGADDHYTERLVRMSTLPTYQRRIRPPSPATRADLGLPSDGPMYLCPHRLPKYHPDFDPLLAGVLRSDPRGFVVILEGGSRHGVALLQQRLARNLGSLFDRVHFLPPRKQPDYHRLLSLADVFLDTPHYSAGLMAYDAFSLGVPIVTLPGEFNVSRYTAALYWKMGIADCIASSPDDYVCLAVRLGTDPDYRHEIRRQIAQRSDVLAQTVRDHEQFFETAIEAARHSSRAAAG
jgi:protein O-GlcNAc transferase